jgi:hypothetical protein
MGMVHSRRSSRSIVSELLSCCSGSERRIKM